MVVVVVVGGTVVVVVVGGTVVVVEVPSVIKIDVSTLVSGCVVVSSVENIPSLALGLISVVEVISVTVISFD